MQKPRYRHHRYRAFALVCALPLFLVACGGGGGGPGPGGAGQGLVLVSFLQAGVDNLPLNTVLEFTFSEPVDARTVDRGTIQIRKGPDFGETARGSFRVAGAKVYFEPDLPTDCTLTSAGLRPATDYRIIVVGSPEEFCIENTKGQKLDRTTTYEMRTLPEGDPLLLQDQIPGVAPSVLETSPATGEAAVSAGDGGAVVVTFSENLDPCSVDAQTVICRMLEVGAPGTFEPAENGNLSGFVPVEDSTPGDPNTWGASTSTPVNPAQTIPVSRILEQTPAATRLRLRPVFGEFPDNALIVVQLTFGVTDFGGQSLVPTTISFTTENLAARSGSLDIEFDAGTPVDDTLSTAEVNSSRSPSRAQAWLLFSGDGDNGSDLLSPSLPETPDSGCAFARQSNDGVKDDFDPPSDVVLDTGSTPNTCDNTVDGSAAVVWEFRTFRIRSGVTVRIVGVNPAVILVQQGAVIDSGGRLLARGDGLAGTPQSDGRTGYAWASGATTITKGGEAVAGGGDGGDAALFDNATHGEDGFSAFGSEDGLGVQGGQGAGLGGVNHDTTYPNSPGTSQGGGGGGHGVPGETSPNVLGTAHTNQGATRGDGGEAYPDSNAGTRMRTPSAGGGGGAGGNEEWDQSYDGVYSTGGGSGGAGGGFVDITAGGDILIAGTIDASGGDGGDGGSSSYYAGPGGGGGGAGGGIRLITPEDIVLAPTAVLTAAGGQGGTSPNGTSGTGGPQNHGADGGHGRIVLEDGDSVVTGLGTAAVLPTEGQDGFFRGPFDPTRFQGGGLEPIAVSDLILLGPVSAPTFLPLQPADFVADIPAPAAFGNGTTSMLCEMQGYPMLPDGSPDLSAPTGWYTVGYFASTVAGATWFPEASPGDVPSPADSAGVGIANLDGSRYVQIRIHFWLPNGMSPTQPGPYVDRWTIRFAYDN